MHILQITHICVYLLNWLCCFAGGPHRSTSTFVHHARSRTLKGGMLMMRVKRNLERWDMTMTDCCTLRLPTCAVWMALCRASKMALNRSIYWLLPANTSECYLYTEQMGVKCIIVNHAVLRYFIAQDSHTTDGGSTFW